MPRTKKAPVEEKAKEPEILVEATQAGVYGMLRQAGDRFMIAGETYTEKDKENKTIPPGKEVGDPKAFSERWMKYVEEEEKTEKKEESAT